MQKRISITVVLILLVAFVLSSFSLVKTHDRDVTYSLPSDLKTQVRNEAEGMTQEQIIDYSLELTASILQFHRKNDIDGGEANCVGYAQLCSAICNEALKVNGYSNRAKPVVGYVKNCGVNICTVLKSISPNDQLKAFVKDHDFVELRIGDKYYYFDPSIYDVLGNKCMTIK